jgi:cysteine desulfurase
MSVACRRIGEDGKDAGKAAAGRPLYFDYQATTPTDPRVVAKMLPFFSEAFGNPHSDQHAYGWEARDAVHAAREEIAALIGAEAREIVFTSGATESNNLAIKGVARFKAKYAEGTPPQIVTAATEHKCVLESCARMEREGVPVTRLGVDRDGMIDLGALEEALQRPTALVSIMAANNEIGVLQPLAEIGALCRQYGTHFHSDAAQAVGKIPIDVEAMNIDLLSISGHKVYGPMGIGALYIRRRPRVRLEIEMDGGGQERGFRSGTLPAPLCVGLGEACRLAGLEMDAEAERLTGLRQRFHQGLMGRLSGVSLNGHPDKRLPGNLNYHFEGLDAQALIKAMPGLAVSTGSACSSADVEPSYVLRALGLSPAAAAGSIRIGLGRTTTAEEVAQALDIIVAAVQDLRARQAAPAARSE